MVIILGQIAHNVLGNWGREQRP